MLDQNSEKVYEFLRDYIAKKGGAPSYKEIEKGCNITATTVVRSLDKLEAWGRIIRYPGQARGIALPKTEA